MQSWLQRLAWLCLAVALGSGLAALQFSVGIPRWVMQSVLIAVLGAALVAAFIVAGLYYREVAKDDEDV